MLNVEKELLLSSLPGMAYRCQVEAPWAMQYVSAGVRFVCSLEPEDFTSGRIAWGNLVHPKDLPRLERELHEALAARQPFNFHYRILDKKTGTRWMNEAGQAIYDLDGQPQALVGFIIDVTEHALVQDRLREAEQRYAFAAKATGEIIWDRELETNRVNRIVPEDTDLAGISPDAINNLDWWEQRIHPDDTEHVLASIEQLLKSGRSHWSSEYRLRRDDGSFADIYDQGFVVPSAEGRPRRMVGAMQDISKRKAAEAQLEQLQAQLIHLSHNSAMSAMAATLAHELNQPLAAAANYLAGSHRMAERELGEDSLIRVGLEETQQQIQRAGEIIRRMRSLVSKDPSRRELVSIRTVLGRVRQLVLANGVCPNLRFRVDVEKGADIVFVDQIQLEQVLLNLIRNASEAMSEVEQPEILILTSRASDDFVEVKIVDQGCGLPEATMESLFTAYGNSTSGGLGVGLSICRTIIEAHGGRIWAENNPDVGSHFAFLVPTSAPAA